MNKPFPFLVIAALALWRPVEARALSECGPAFDPVMPGWAWESIALLKDRRAAPGERVSAAANLASFVDASHSACTVLLGVLEDDAEPEPLRRAGAKSLSSGQRYESVRDGLTRLGGSQGPASEDLRAVALKSLYRAAAYPPVERDLERIFQDRQAPLALRRAAIWACFQAAGAGRTRFALLQIAQQPAEDEQLRVEGVKSLFGVMNMAFIRDTMVRLVKDGREVSAVRHAAALGLVLRSGDRQVRAALEDLVDGPDRTLAEAAWRALRGQIDYGMTEFFHLERFPSGQPRDPLINE